MNPLPGLSLPFRHSLIRAVNACDDAPLGHISAINIACGQAGWSVIKFGTYPNEVGLQVFDREAADAIATAFNSRRDQFATPFRGLPIYVGHPDYPQWAKANPSVRAEAVGRIREMKIEADGLHLRASYNDEGDRLVKGDAPAYDAFSPNWGMRPIVYQGRTAFRPVELFSIGLTNKPNIPGSFIGVNVHRKTQTADNGGRRGLAGDSKKITAINEAIAARMTALGTKDRTVAYNALVREGHELFKLEAGSNGSN